MAQHFLNLGFQKPYSGELPHALANVAGNPSPFAFARSAGAVWGYGEHVYQTELFDTAQGNVAASNTVTLVTGLTQADILFKFNDRTTTKTTSNSLPSIALLLDDPTNAVHGIDLNRTNDATQAKTATLKASTGSPASKSSSTFFASAFSAGTPRYVRLNFTATTLRAKGWNFTEAEPSNWGLEYTSGLTIGTSSLLLDIVQLAQVQEWHWLAYSDVAATPAYKASVPASDTTDLPSGSRTITVTVSNAQGQLQDGANVYLYHQATGMIVDDAVTDSTGVATFYVETEDVFYALAKDTNNKIYSYNFLNE